MAAASSVALLDVSSRSAFSNGLALGLGSSSSSSSVGLKCKRSVSVQASSSPSSSDAPKLSSFKKLAAAFAAAAFLASAPIVMSPPEAQAAGALGEFGNLTRCKDSKAFSKRQKQAAKKIEAQIKKYPEDSAAALALNLQLQQSKKRFERYGNSNLLCGPEGLPHLIVDGIGNFQHAGEFIIPGLGFLYIAGWIGWSGRSYLIEIKKGPKPAMKEIIIDVPLALPLVGKALIWPLLALGELRSGKLVMSDEDITVSPR